jgi:hypothetical protein
MLWILIICIVHAENPYSFNGSTEGCTSVPSQLLQPVEYGSLSPTSPGFTVDQYGSLEMTLILPYIPQYAFWFVMLDAPDRWNDTLAYGLRPGTCDSVSLEDWYGYFRDKDNTWGDPPFPGNPTNAYIAYNSSTYPFSTTPSHWSFKALDCGSLIYTFTISLAELLQCRTYEGKETSHFSVSDGSVIITGDVVLQMAHVDVVDDAYETNILEYRHTYSTTVQQSTTTTSKIDNCVDLVVSSVTLDRPFDNNVTTCVTLRWNVCYGHEYLPIYPDYLPPPWANSVKYTTQSYNTTMGIICADVSCPEDSECGGTLTFNMSFVNSTAYDDMVYVPFSIYIAPKTRFGGTTSFFDSMWGISLDIKTSEMQSIGAETVLQEGDTIFGTVTPLGLWPGESVLADVILTIVNVYICDPGSRTNVLYDMIKTQGCLAVPNYNIIVRSSKTYYNESCYHGSYYSPFLTQNQSSVGHFSFLFRSHFLDYTRCKPVPTILSEMMIHVEAFMSFTVDTNKRDRFCVTKPLRFTSSMKLNTTQKYDFPAIIRKFWSGLGDDYSFSMDHTDEPIETTEIYSSGDQASNFAILFVLFLIICAFNKCSS